MLLERRDNSPIKDANSGRLEFSQGRKEASYDDLFEWLRKDCSEGDFVSPLAVCIYGKFNALASNFSSRTMELNKDSVIWRIGLSDIKGQTLDNKTEDNIQFYFYNPFRCSIENGFKFDLKNQSDINLFNRLNFDLSIITFPLAGDILDHLEQIKRGKNIGIQYIIVEGKVEEEKERQILNNSKETNLLPPVLSAYGGELKFIYGGRH